MDDMSGDLERENAQVIPISCHPDFKSNNPFDIQFDPDESDMDIMDEEMIGMLAGPSSKSIKEGNIFGNSSCYSCIHSLDNRPAWKRLFFTADENSYDCTFIQRTRIKDPVSGQIRYLEVMNGVFGQQVRVVDNPHERCVTMNPDGRCQAFNVSLVDK